MRPRCLLCPLTLALLAGCGSGPDAIQVDPPEPVLRVGERLELRAEPLEELAGEPTWEVQELHGGGFLRSTGLRVTYLAPPSAGTYHVVLRAPRAEGGSAKGLLELRVLPDLRVLPAEAAVAPGGSLAFTARLRGLPRPTVTWRVEEASGGQVSPDGRYSAPGHTGVFHVVATSTVDPSVSATAVVRVS